MTMEKIDHHLLEAEEENVEVKIEKLLVVETLVVLEENVQIVKALLEVINLQEEKNKYTSI